MHRLFVGEKSSLVQAVVAVLPGTPRRNGVVTYIGDDAFVPLAGHALEQAMPDEYLPDEVPRSKSGSKIWRYQDLPIVPTDWLMAPRGDLERNVRAVGKLLSEVDQVVHLGDPDEEGQLLVDEVLIYLGNTKPVLRLLVNDYNAAKVRQALDSMRSNEEPQFRAWFVWALARSRYDWLFGLNLTRAATLRARDLGFDGVLTVGSVQTPTLMIVYGRDRAIETFKPVAYFVVAATVQHQNGVFAANWKAREDQAGFDDAGRLIDESIAQALVAQLQHRPAKISAYDKSPKREAPPLPLSLNELTVAACGNFGYTGDEVLAAAQVLYERYKVTSYPRTENRYLSEAQHDEAPAVLASVGQNVPGLGSLVGRADTTRKSAAFDDKKMDGQAHHGIVPTVCVTDLSALTEIERNVYDLVVRSYLAQFFEHAVFMQTRIEVSCVGERLSANGKTPVSAGWRDVYAPHEDAAARSPGDGETDDSKQTLPDMAHGDPAMCTACDTTSRTTKPPARLDEASLLTAMIDLHKFTTDPAAKARLKAGKGIGTSATRAGIIKDLRERGFLEIAKGTKNKLTCSASGRGLLAALPGPVKDPTMAGMFKIALDAVASGQITYDQFIERNVAFITKVIAGLRHSAMNLPMAPAPVCPKCALGRLRRIAGNDGHFWDCSNFKAESKCAASYPDRDGAPDFTPKSKAGRKGFGFKKMGAM
ncbi:DNA topoisomerase [Caballeronia sordidicola]|uniref:DNA topoisomerase n=1 Tax=Caballeronia sordidicola TaxID=196367 RepID=A0A242MRB4_CABSO|nr:DNA topoisomerase [Caballeronia sordidicola]OTP73797.1 DNA topoisomerase III [Caballeronia sordidicola]